MKIELVVFDIAGTVVNDSDAVNGCIRDALAAVGVHVDAAAVNRVMGLPKPDAIRQLLSGVPDGPELLVQLGRIHADFVARMQHFYATDPSVYAIAGATDVFATLRAIGIKVALDTGFSRDIVEVIMARLKWREGETVDRTMASDEVARGRPHPDMIRALMRELDIADAGRVAKLGDTPADLEEGSAAGCGLIIGITSGTHTRAQLAPYPHTYFIDTVADLPELFRSIGAL